MFFEMEKHNPSFFLSHHDRYTLESYKKMCFIQSKQKYNKTYYNRYY